MKKDLRILAELQWDFNEKKHTKFSQHFAKKFTTPYRYYFECFPRNIIKLNMINLKKKSA